MPLETAPYVADLVATNPAATDAVAQGDAHLRLIKAALVATFPNADGAVTADAARMNDVFDDAPLVSTVNTFALRQTLTVGADGASFRRNSAELDPIGVPKLWLTGTVPAGHLALNGQAVSRTTYSALFALWSTTFGAGNGTTTFNLPDVQGTFPVAASGSLPVGTSGGSQTPTVTVGSGGGHTPSITVATGGSHSHGAVTGGTALSIAQMPAHSHTVTDPGHTHGTSGPGGIANTSAGPSLNYTTFPGSNQLFEASLGIATAYTGISIASAGSGSAHTHAITADAGHTHTATAAAVAAHTHTATIADGRPPFIAYTFIVRAL